MIGGLQRIKSLSNHGRLGKGMTFVVGIKREEKELLIEDHELWMGPRTTAAVEWCKMDFNYSVGYTMKHGGNWGL